MNHPGVGVERRWRGCHEVGLSESAVELRPVRVEVRLGSVNPLKVNPRPVNPWEVWLGVDVFGAVFECRCCWTQIGLIGAR